MIVRAVISARASERKSRETLRYLRDGSAVIAKMKLSHSAKAALVIKTYFCLLSINSAGACLVRGAKAPANLPNVFNFGLFRYGR